MKVAVCYTKDNASGHAICNHFLEGVIANGDEAVPVYSVNDLSALEHCDVSFQVCEYPDFLTPSSKADVTTTDIKDAAGETVVVKLS